MGTIRGLFPLPVIRMYGYFSFIMTSFNWTERISASRAPVENRNRIMKRSRTPIFVWGGCARSSSISALSSQLWRFGYVFLCFTVEMLICRGTSSISRVAAYFRYAFIPDSRTFRVPTLLLLATLLKNPRITSSVTKSVVIWSTVFE